MEMSGQLHVPVALPPGEGAHVTHWLRGWVDLRAGVDAEAKRKIRSPCRESNPVLPARSLITIVTELQ
jgi:hypothetical protein